jgi:hypothetical protein
MLAVKDEGQAIGDPQRYVQDIVDDLLHCGLVEYITVKERFGEEYTPSFTIAETVGWFFDIEKIPGDTQSLNLIWNKIAPAFPELFKKSTQGGSNGQTTRLLALRISYIPPCTKEKIFRLTETGFFVH